MTNQPDAVELSPEPAGSAPRARSRPLANRNFRLLWLGENVSLLGDQFYFIALPWLIFQLTDSSLALGTVLMVAGIPRAVLMLLGGVLTDRFSPRIIMLVSNLLRLGVVGLLTLLIAGEAAQLWMLYVIALCFGVVDAFFYPAYRAMMPIIVEERALQASNSLMMSTTQLVQSAGPGLAGELVRRVGLVRTFAFDAFTFLFSAVTLLLMRVPAAAPSEGSETAKRRGVRTEIGEMLAYVWRDPMLPTIITVLAAINLLFVGPLVVGSATLGNTRFVEYGSAAYGWMLSAFSVGSLIGTLTAGALAVKRKPLISLTGVSIQGLLMIGIAYSMSLTVVCGLWGLIGLAAGFGGVTVVTATQKRVSKDMMGRFMSIVALAEVGLTPISQALAGLVADVDVKLMFVGAGILLTLAALTAISNRDIRNDEV